MTLTSTAVNQPPSSATSAAAATAVPTTAVQRKGTYDTDIWITDGAWITGIVGALTTFLLGFWFYKVDALGQGVTVAGWQLAHTRDDAVLLALLVVGVAMIVTELLRLALLQRGQFTQKSPLLSNGQRGEFLQECVFIFLKNALLLWLVAVMYRNVSDYPAWNQLISILLTVYLWAGLPYTLLTRAYKHNPEADLTDYPALVGKVLNNGLAWLGVKRIEATPFDYNDKKTALGLLVKLFFAPIMTLFFFNQFPYMVRNIGYLIDFLPAKLASGNYTHGDFNKDFYNIAKAFLLSVDVALAWCGYIITSRWLDNQIQSAEPTLLGWSVCLLSYPPFQMLGLYFSYPAEAAIFRYDSPWAISLFVMLAIASYFIYMCATLAFGVRFSNLTHRGIIRKGPFAIVRHPAYASKNLSWWLVILPAIILNMQSSGYLMALVLTVGLSVQTWIYYMRAITEERHLSADPVYLEYCQHVKYRFIPGVI